MQTHQKARCAPKEQRGEEMIHIVNAGDRTFRIPWQTGTGQFIEINPGTKKQFTQKIAWSILGNTDLLPGQDHKPMPGSAGEWNRQVGRLQAFHGYFVDTNLEDESPMEAAVRMRKNPHDIGDKKALHSFDGKPRYNRHVDPLSWWKYILDGKLYVEEWVPRFGKGTDLYRQHNETVVDAPAQSVGGIEIPIGAGTKRGSVGGMEIAIK